MKSILISILFASVFYITSCTYPRQPIKYTGSINNRSALPRLTIQADDYTYIQDELTTVIYTFGNRQRINVGDTLFIGGDLTYMKYKSVSQQLNGSSDWFIKWKHNKYGSGQKLITFKGKEVYAVNKPKLKIGLIPKKIKKAAK